MKRLLFLFVSLALLAETSEVLAHGGFHPTPWPEPQPPTDTTPVPTPPPPVPTPQPTPQPVPEDPEPTPEPTDTPDDSEPTATPTDPRKSGGSSSSTGPSDLLAWQRWWEIHRWKWARAEQTEQVTTPGAPDEEQISNLTQFLKKALAHQYFDVRSAAALSLGKTGATSTAPDLLALLKDKNYVVRESACLALGMMRAKSAFTDLMKVLETPSATDRLRVHAALALGLMGDPAAGQLLMRVARHSRTDDEVRAAAMLGLSLLKYEPGMAEMIAMIKNRAVKDELLAVAATALAKSGIRKVRQGKTETDISEFLIRALETYTKERFLRQAIALGLPDLAPLPPEVASKAIRRLVYVYSQARDDRTRGFLLLTLGELAPDLPGKIQAMAVIRRVLQIEKRRSVQAFAALAAGLSGDRQAVKPLRLLLQRGGAIEVRSAAAVALGLLSDAGSTKALVSEIDGRGNPSLQGYCCMALGLMGRRDNTEALPVLRRVIREGNLPEVRAAAAMALARLGVMDALDSLLPALREANHYLRMSAILAVGHFRQEKAIAPLMDLYNSREINDETRAIILVALGNIAEKGDTPVLKRISDRYDFLMTRFSVLRLITRLL